MENTNKPGNYPRPTTANTNESAEKCIDDLIVILSKTRFEQGPSNHLQKKFAIASDLLSRTSSDSGLMQNLKLQSATARKYNFARKLSRVFRLVVAVLLILLGFGMIIMPAPPYFEMFTLFYLNPNDGVTIMDVISLIVAFTGISLLITGLIKFNDGPRK